ncbi:hypothetical protein MKK58_13295 [Methylobacterium sp. J-078]|uniref:YMGG-like glycine zipper-containing protein n=1 Tax=Methylobacterium sp. J-078 TaxID=2836657 RepID=UPI001FBB78FA|nr:YMGG-like glycine zipper-containing protein [Methylobacterium sp. J-078]MCJ2045498.1 hypothetical protein [Methylobacterium sp. J-078]
MMTRTVRTIGAALCLGAVLAGCTSTRGGGAASAGPGGSIDEAVSRCIASTLVGAGVGALLGAAVGGGRRAGVGAAIGAGVGGLACTVLTALDAQDKQRIRNAQIAAAATNRPQYLAYQGADGAQRAITVRPQPAPAQAATGIPDRICRATDTQATINGTGSAELPQQLVCRTPGGDWLPA